MLLPKFLDSFLESSLSASIAGSKSRNLNRMQSLSSNKDSDQTSADSLATLDGGCSSSMWLSSKENAFEQHYCQVKQSESHYQDQDSSSSLSTGQSDHEATHFSSGNFHVRNINTFQPGVFESYRKNAEDCLKPSLLCGSSDYFSTQVQAEHIQSSGGYVSYPLAEPYFGRIIAAYEPSAVAYPQMMGVASTRVILPLDCTKGMPIYVNAKQYHAILRRRQFRAKLMAQNKLAKSKKKYLHESRHLHALKRARGSGGRFLNTRNKQGLEPPTQIDEKNLSSGKRTADASEPQTQHSGSNNWGTSTAYSSDFSCLWDGEDIPQQHEFRVSMSSFPSSQSRVPTLDDRLLLSIDRCSRISTAT